MKKQYEKTYISTATTTQVKTGACTLHYIVVNTTAAGTIKVIDGTSGTTANVATLVASIAEGTYKFHCVMKSGIRIVTAGASDITVCYSV
jgi:hypothetical protein